MAPLGAATQSGSGRRPPSPGHGYSAAPGEQERQKDRRLESHTTHHPGHTPPAWSGNPHLLLHPFQTLLILADLSQLLQRCVHPATHGNQQPRASGSRPPPLAPPTPEAPPHEGPPSSPTLWGPAPLRLHQEPGSCLAPIQGSSQPKSRDPPPRPEAPPPARPRPHFCDMRFRRSESLSRLSRARVSRKFSFCTDSHVSSLRSASFER